MNFLYRLRDILYSLLLLFFTHTAVAQVPSYVPTNGLVGWWPFNGNANDESGNGNNGTVNGVTLSADRFGQSNRAYSFDGVNDRIEIASSNSLESNSLSVSFWLKTTSNAFQQIIYKVTPNTAANEMYSIPLNLNQAGTINFDLKNSSCSPGVGWQYLSANSSSVTSWTFFSMTHDGIETKIYRNGQLISSAPGNFGISYCPGGTLLFGTSWQYNHFLSGQLDDIGIWNRALTPQEITNLYLSGQPCPTVGAIQGPSSVIAGNTITLTDTTAGGTWSSSHPAIATVNSSGVVTGVAPGTDTIRYTVNTICGPVTVFKVITVTSACLPSYVPTNGLVGWWPFCGNANDESGNGNNGTVNGATLTTDRFGQANKAYSFDGVDDKIEMGFLPNANFSSNASFSYSLWIKPDGVKFGRVLSFTSNIVGDLSFIHQLTYEPNGLLSFNCAQYTGMVNPPYAQVSSTPLVANQWYHIILTYAANSIRIHVNGIGTSTALYSGPLSLDGANSELHIGYIPAEPTERFSGKIDDIGIWNRALTPQEITSLYGGGCTAQIAQNDTLICAGQSISLSTNMNIANDSLFTEYQLFSYPNIHPTGGSYLTGIDYLGDGTLVASGVFYEGAGANQLLCRFDTTGTLIWSKKRDPGTDHAYFWQATKNGNELLAAGTQNAQGSCYFDGIFVRYDLNGNELGYSIQCISGSTDLRNYVHLPNGNYLSGGGAASGNHIEYLNSSFSQLTLTLIPLDNKAQRLTKVIHNNQNGEAYFIGPLESDPFFNVDGAIYRFDSSLSFVNKYFFDLGGDEYVYDGRIVNNNFVLCGTSFQTSAKAFVALTNLTGSLIDTITFSFPGETNARWIIPHSSGYICLIEHYPNTSSNSILVYLDSNLEIVDTIQFSSPNPFTFFSNPVLPLIIDNTLYFVGYTGTNNDVTNISNKPALIKVRLKSLFNPITQTFVWSTGSALDNITIAPLQTTQYYLTVSQDGYSCTDSVLVTVRKPDVVIAATDSIFCSYDSVQLNASGAQSYLWNNGAASSSTFAKQTLTYSVIGTDSLGCKDTAAIQTLIADTLTWTGAVDVNWHKACNWNPAKVPGCCNSVVIPLTANKPSVNGIAGCKDITIHSTSGAQLNVQNGALLQIEQCPTPITKTGCP